MFEYRTCFYYFLHCLYFCIFWTNQQPPPNFFCLPPNLLPSSGLAPAPAFAGLSRAFTNSFCPPSHPPRKVYFCASSQLGIWWVVLRLSLVGLISFVGNFCPQLLFTSFVHNFCSQLLFTSFVDTLCLKLLFQTFLHNFSK